MKESEFNVIEENDVNGITIYNTRSGGVLDLDAAHMNKLNLFRKGAAALDGDFEEALKMGGMLVDDDVDERRMLMLESLSARFANDYLGLTIAPTLACNFRCPYCYEKGCSHPTMSEETMTDIAEFVRSGYSGINDLHVDWYGGEPLLCVDMIERLTKELRGAIRPGATYSAGMVTNGYLLTRKIAQKLADCQVGSVQITIDGSKRDHDSRRVPADGRPTYDAIIDNIISCADVLQITIRVNVDESNSKEVDALIDELDAKGLRGKVAIYLAAVDNVNDTCSNDIHCFSQRGFSQVETFFMDKASERGFNVIPFTPYEPGVCCAVSLNSFVIDPLGRLFKCWDEVGKGECAVGNVREGVKANSNYLRWMEYLPNDPVCGECVMFPACMGGCPHAAMEGQRKCASVKFNARQRMRLACNYQYSHEANHDV